MKRPHPLVAGSLSTEEAHARWRQSYERLRDGGATASAWKVAGACWLLTVPYSKAAERVFLSGILPDKPPTLVDLTAADRRTVQRGIRECMELGAIQWTPSPGNVGSGKPSTIRLPAVGEPVGDGDADRAIAAELAPTPAEPEWCTECLQERLDVIEGICAPCREKLTA